MIGGLYELRLIILGIFLTYASYQDYRYREIDDEVWLLCASLSLPLTLYDHVVINREDVIMFLFSIGISGVLSYAFYVTGLYGGADAKCITTMALSAPLLRGTNNLHPFLPLSSVMNALILALAVPLALFLYNTYRILRGEKIFEGLSNERLLRKILAMFVGTRILDVGERSFWAPMEVEIGSKGGRRFNFSVRIDDFGRPLEPNRWASPGIPLVIFLSLGYCLAVLRGDVLSMLLGY